MTTEHGDTRDALRALDQQRADTLADALRPDALTDDTPTPETWRVVEPDGSVNVLYVQSIGGDVYIIRCESLGREHVRAASSRCAVERFAGQYLGAAEIRGPGEATTAEQLDALRAEVEHLRGLVERASEQVHAVAEERDAAEQRAWAIKESRDETRAAFDAMTHDRNEANRHRRVAHKALDAVAALLFVPLRDLGYDRAAEVLCAHIEELYQQRTAARNEEYAHAAAHARADALQAKVATLTQERDEARAERRAARLDRDAAEERLAALVRGGDRG